MIFAFSIPLFAMLAIQGAEPALFLAYAGYMLVGLGIGLVYRRVWLDTSLEVFRLRERLLSRIQVDSLTGLLNREGWETRARRAFDRAMAGQRPVSVAYFDLDHFKRANDTHGHAAGDTLLRTVATTLREQCWPGELVARVGGEEFLVLLPGTGEDEAYACAERVRRAIAALPGPIPVSVSCGVAACRPASRWKWRSRARTRRCSRPNAGAATWCCARTPMHHHSRLQAPPASRIGGPFSVAPSARSCP